MVLMKCRYIFTNVLFCSSILEMNLNINNDLTFVYFFPFSVLYNSIKSIIFSSFVEEFSSFFSSLPLFHFIIFFGFCNFTLIYFNL